jgi:hypothetical protein
LSRPLKEPTNAGLSIKAPTRFGEPLRTLDRLAQKRPRSGARLDQTQEDADRRRLPRSIRTHEPDHNTVGNLERKVVHRNELPEAPGQPICGQRAPDSLRAVDVISADFLRVGEVGVLEPVLCR